MKFIVEGGQKLHGDVEIYKAKNSVLALLAASILTEEEVVLKDCPKIVDVQNMIKILEALGAKVAWSGSDVHIDAKTLSAYEIPEAYAREIRSSIFLVGSLLARSKKAKAVFPGGCEIGLRPIDLHLKGLRDLGVIVTENGGDILFDGSAARGASVHLDFPSVGATENLLMASTLISGTTIITNAAKEPEIIALAEFLRCMGAKVGGEGTSTIVVEGVKKLCGATFTPIPDRIATGTFLLAAAITGGDVCVKNCSPCHARALLSKLNGFGGDVKISQNEIRIKGYNRPKSIKLIETQPYPGFPTDLQAQILALECVSDGASIIVENMFETRFKHVSELVKMGADIVVRDRTAFVRGVKKLHGASVTASDLRAGAALVIAALSADGATEIENVKQIDRGYYKLEEQLSSLGASIKRV